MATVAEIFDDMGQAHALVKYGEGKPGLHGDYGCWVVVCAIVIPIFALISAFFFSMLDHSSIWSEQDIAWMHENFTVPGLWIGGSGSTLLALGFCYSLYKPHAEYESYKMRLFTGDQQVTDPQLPGFSYGWGTSLGVMPGLRPRTYHFMWHTNGKDRNKLNWRGYYLVLNKPVQNINAWHTVYSPMLDLQELLLWMYHLKNMSYNFDTNQRTICSESIQAAQDSWCNGIHDNRATSDNEKFLINKGFWQIGEADACWSQRMQEGEFLVGRKLQDITPKFVQDIGFVAVTVKCNGRWYGKLLFDNSKDEGNGLQMKTARMMNALSDKFNMHEIPDEYVTGVNGPPEVTAQRYGAHPKVQKMYEGYLQHHDLHWVSPETVKPNS